MKIVFFSITLMLLSMNAASQQLIDKYVGCWKVNYFAAAEENTTSFPETLRMEYTFYSTGDYVYSVHDLSTNSKNEQKGKFQVSTNSLKLTVDDTSMDCTVFRLTSQEIVFKTTVENEELFFIMNKYNCK